MKLIALIAVTLLAWSSAYARPLQSKIESIKGQVKLLIDMDQITDPVDIVFVIDNSASMTSYQQVVIDNSSKFIDGLSQGGSNWRIGLISTSVDEPAYIGMDPGSELEASTPDGVNKFKAAVQHMGNNGDTFEKPFDAIKKALLAHPNFLRQGARLALIVVTDAPEQSAVPTAEFVKMLSDMKGGLTGVTFNGFLGPVDWCSPTDDVYSWAGSKFEELTKAVAGAATPICTPAFANTVAKLGGDLSQHARSGNPVPEIPLPSVPDFSTLTLNFGTQILDKGILPSGWVYDSGKNEVILGNQIQWSVQPLHTPLEVTYTTKDWVK